MATVFGEMKHKLAARMPSAGKIAVSKMISCHRARVRFKIRVLLEPRERQQNHAASKTPGTVRMNFRPLLPVRKPRPGDEREFDARSP